MSPVSCGAFHVPMAVPAVHRLDLSNTGVLRLVRLGCLCLLLDTSRLAAGMHLPTAERTSGPAALDVSAGCFSFTVTTSSSGSSARCGELVTPHGTVLTPAFVFCATKAAMKTVSPAQARAEGTQFIVSNTYHLMLTPGSELVERMGGLQRWSGWNGPMLTDSGGFQIFSMGHGSVSDEIKGSRDLLSLGRNQTLLALDEDGATFRSYIDGSIQRLSPERSIEIQRQLGADLILVLDECTPFNVDRAYTDESMRRSHRWALRSLREFQRTDQGRQALYGIVQGGVYEDLRRESAEFVNSQPFFGAAIGGSLGDSRKTMHDIVRFTRSALREDRPVHLLGIGGIRDIFHGVRCGIDSFDCVHPTRIARHGGALVKAKHWNEPPPPPGPNPAPTKKSRVSNPLEKRPVREHINVSKGRFRWDPRPIDDSCGCYCCRNFNRAYLHHLFKAGESLGGALVTAHNIHFMNALMRDIRSAARIHYFDLHHLLLIRIGRVSRRTISTAWRTRTCIPR